MPKHAATADPAPARQLSDLVVALLRTAVPAWWGTLVAWAIGGLVTLLPASIADSLATLLSSDPAVALAVTVAIAAWYAVWRWLSPRVPDWLIRLALGSVRTPTYAPVVNGVAQITTLSAPSAEGLHRHDWVFLEHVSGGFRRYRCSRCGAREIEPRTGTTVTPALSATERDNLAQLAAALDEGDPGRTALERVLTT